MLLFITLSLIMSTTTEVPSENNSAPAEVQPENGEIQNWTALYVGDLDVNVTEGELKQLFAEKGDVVSVKICTNEAQESLGYGYINLRTPEDAKKALESLNFTLVHGKQIRVAYSCPNSNSRHNHAANLFVKNLDKSIEDQEFYNMFAEYGVVVSSKIRKDVSGVSKGFGYVQFEKEESARKAIEEMNGVSFAGKELYVGLFVSKEERLKEFDNTKFTNLYVKNLTESTTEEELRNHFRKFGMLNSVVVMKDQDGNSKGFGFVDFEKHEDAKNAIESLNGSLFYGEELYVARAQKKSEREAQLKRVHQRIVTSSQGLNNLYVRNLDDDVDDDKLKFMFSSFGTITSCKVILNTRGISKGFGFVAFSTAHEGAKAISQMNGKLVGRKPLYVAVAEKKEDRLARYKAMFSNNLPHTIMPTFVSAPLPPHGLAPRSQILDSQTQVRPAALLQPHVGSSRSMSSPMVQGLRPPYPPLGYMRPLPIFPMMPPHPHSRMLQHLPRYYPGQVMPNGHPYGAMGIIPPLARSRHDEKRVSSSLSDGVGTSTLGNDSSMDQAQVLGTDVAFLIDSPEFLEEKVDAVVQALKDVDADE